MDELPDDMIDLIDEIHHNLNQHGLQLLQIALTSKKARNEILDRIEVLKENYDGKQSAKIRFKTNKNILRRFTVTDDGIEGIEVL